MQNSLPWHTLHSTLRLLGRPADVLRGIRRAHLGPDLFAALTVTMVVLPQTMAYAILGGLPPEVGLYSAAVASIVGALWGSSIQLQTGPSNTVALLTLAAIAPLAPRHASLPGGSQPAGTHGRPAAPGDGAGPARPAGALRLRCGHRGVHRGRGRAHRRQPAPRSAVARPALHAPSWWRRCRRSAST